MTNMAPIWPSPPTTPKVPGTPMAARKKRVTTTPKIRRPGLLPQPPHQLPWTGTEEEERPSNTNQDRFGKETYLKNLSKINLHISGPLFLSPTASLAAGEAGGRDLDREGRKKGSREREEGYSPTQESAVVFSAV